MTHAFHWQNPQIQLQQPFSLGLVGFPRESSSLVQGGVDRGAEVERGYKPLLAFFQSNRGRLRFQLFSVDSELISQFSAVPGVSVFSNLV